MFGNLPLAPAKHKQYKISLRFGGFLFNTTEKFNRLIYTKLMIMIEDSVVFDEILTHIENERVRAKLVDKSFDLGIVTDKRASTILELIEKNMNTLKKIGMSHYIWHDDALRSSLKIAGEELLVSLCAPRR